MKIKIYLNYYTLFGTGNVRDKTRLRKLKVTLYQPFFFVLKYVCIKEIIYEIIIIPLSKHVNNKICLSNHAKVTYACNNV